MIFKTFLHEYFSYLCLFLIFNFIKVYLHWELKRLMIRFIDLKLMYNEIDVFHLKSCDFMASTIFINKSYWLVTNQTEIVPRWQRIQGQCIQSAEKQEAVGWNTRQWVWRICRCLGTYWASCVLSNFYHIHLSAN